MKDKIEGLAYLKTGYEFDFIFSKKLNSPLDFDELDSVFDGILFDPTEDCIIVSNRKTYRNYRDLLRRECGGGYLRTFKWYKYPCLDYDGMAWILGNNTIKDGVILVGYISRKKTFYKKLNIKAILNKKQKIKRYKFCFAGFK